MGLTNLRIRVDSSSCATSSIALAAATGSAAASDAAPGKTVAAGSPEAHPPAAAGLKLLLSSPDCVLSGAVSPSGAACAAQEAVRGAVRPTELLAAGSCSTGLSMGDMCNEVLNVVEVSKSVHCSLSGRPLEQLALSMPPTP